MVPAMPATRLPAALLLLSACAATPAPVPSAPAPAAPVAAHPFGSRPLKYPAGSIRPSGGQAALDAAVTAAYDRWKAAYVATACGGYHVKAPGEPGQIASSAGNAAGMIITAFMAGHDPQARVIYDGILTLSRKFPSYLEHRSGNLSYAIIQAPDGSCVYPKDKKGNNTGDSAVNGDLDFGFALLLGQRQWSDPRYGEEARKTIATIRQYDFNPTSRVPLIGDWASLPGEPEEWKTSGKTSNFMLGHFRAFAGADDRPFWTETVDKLHALTEATISRYSPSAGLMPLYLRYGTTPPPAKMLGDQNAGHFVGDAGSIPFRLAADVLASGDARSRATLARLLAFVQKATGGDPAKIVDGYNLDGTALAQKGSLEFIAPFGSAAIFDAANQAWLDATWKLMLAAPTGKHDEDTANLLNMILVSGNWWQP
jgi:endo-1,4-beta-D-glucanase Y